MDTPTNYADVCEMALEAKEKYNLTDTQTLLYNHICRGDFKLRNEDGQLFYDKESEGFGYSGSREWVKKQFSILIKEGLVKFKSLRDCRDGKYTSWYFYSPKHDLNDLIDASCYVSTWRLALVKNHLKLEDGFDKKNKTYGDIEFIHNKNGYTFKYKGEESIYSWDNDGKGIKEDLSWLSQGSSTGIHQSTWEDALYYESFDEMIHDIWSFLAHDGVKETLEVPNYIDRRRFTI